MLVSREATSRIRVRRTVNAFYIEFRDRTHFTVGRESRVRSRELRVVQNNCRRLKSTQRLMNKDEKKRREGTHSRAENRALKNAVILYRTSATPAANGREHNNRTVIHQALRLASANSSCSSPSEWRDLSRAIASA